MKKVKHGVLGLGWFGEKHCEALAAIPNVELYAVCTRNSGRLAEVAKKFGAKKTFTDYHAMLADPELESVSITTMWDQHAAPAVAALQAGKHVFLEKPMASTIADCDAIVDAANSAKSFFMVGHICRFNPRYAAAKQEMTKQQMLILRNRSGKTLRPFGGATTPTLCMNSAVAMSADGLYCSRISNDSTCGPRRSRGSSSKVFSSVSPYPRSTWLRPTTINFWSSTGSNVSKRSWTSTRTG